MWPFSTSINVREALGLTFIVVALVLTPVAWMWSRLLWAVAGLLYLLGAVLFFSDRIIKREIKSAKEGGEAAGSNRMPVPTDIYNYTGWGHAGRSAIMSVCRDTTECADCGDPVNPSGDTPEGRGPCGKCGSTKRIHHVSITETLVARDGLGVKAKRAGEKQPYVEDLPVPEYSRSRDKIVHRQRVIDRDHDRYFENVTDYESGDVIHHCEEPLSEHQGHGRPKPIG